MKKKKKKKKTFVRRAVCKIPKVRTTAAVDPVSSMDAWRYALVVAGIHRQIDKAPKVLDANGSKADVCVPWTKSAPITWEPEDLFA